MSKFPELELGGGETAKELLPYAGIWFGEDKAAAQAEHPEIVHISDFLHEAEDLGIKGAQKTSSHAFMKSYNGTILHSAELVSYPVRSYVFQGTNQPWHRPEWDLRWMPREKHLEWRNQFFLTDTAVLAVYNAAVKARRAGQYNGHPLQVLEVMRALLDSHDLLSKSSENKTETKIEH